MNKLAMRKMEPNNIPLILTDDPSGRMSGHPIVQSEAKKMCEMLESLFANTNKKTQVVHTPKNFYLLKDFL